MQERVLKKKWVGVMALFFLLAKTGGMGKNSKRSVSGTEQSVVMWLGSLGEAG